MSQVLSEENLDSLIINHLEEIKGPQLSENSQDSASQKNSNTSGVTPLVGPNSWPSSSLEDEVEDTKYEHAVEDTSMNMIHIINLYLADLDQYSENESTEVSNYTKSCDISDTSSEYTIRRYK